MRIYKTKPAELFLLFLEDSCLKKSNQSDLELSQLNLDSEKFCTYLQSNLLPNWKLVENYSTIQVPYRVNPAINGELPETVLAIAKRYKTDQKSVIDAYQIFAWIKGKGIGATDILNVRLDCPNQLSELCFSPNITAITEDFMVMELLITSTQSANPWQAREELLFGWWGKN